MSDRIEGSQSQQAAAEAPVNWGIDLSDPGIRGLAERGAHKNVVTEAKSTEGTEPQLKNPAASPADTTGGLQKNNGPRDGIALDARDTTPATATKAQHVK